MEKIWNIKTNFDNIEGAVLGYCMGTKWWGKELMPEACDGILQKQ